MTQTEQFLRDGVMLRVTLSYGESILAALVEPSVYGLLLYTGSTAANVRLNILVPWATIRTVRQTEERFNTRESAPAQTAEEVAARQDAVVSFYETIPEEQKAYWAIKDEYDRKHRIGRYRDVPPGSETPVAQPGQGDAPCPE